MSTKTTRQPSEHTASMIGLKGTAGSLGNLLGPALVVLFTPFVSPQVIFLMATALVVALTLASGLVLRLIGKTEPSKSYSNAAVAR